MLVSAAALTLALIGAPDPVSASVADRASGSSLIERSKGPTGILAHAAPAGDWVWPVAGGRNAVRGFEAPASRYSAGHRGIDIAANRGTDVVAPAAGTVRFAGVVVDRSTVTVASPDGVLISMEPVRSELAVGASVAKGGRLGIVSTGGHCSNGCLHLGVRIEGEYVSPLRYFGGVPRAVLLPMR
jgi:murein DD-endopeptidase MepM/ murein hydrolase activator NlpD